MPKDNKVEETKLVAGVSLWKEAWRRLRKNKLAVVCMFIIAVIFSICTIYAIPHLSNLKSEKTFQQTIVDIEYDSPANKAGLKVDDIILKYNNVDVRGYRELERLIDTIKSKEDLDKVELLIKRPLGAKKPKDEKDKAYVEKKILVPRGELGIDTNDPPVFFQDFKRQDAKRINEPPSADHWFGTDYVGRDLFARTLFGGFISFIIGVLATFVASLIGVIYGSVSGYFGGRVDTIMMRVVDILYGLPFLMIIILIKVIADDLKNEEFGGEIIASIINGIFLVVIILILIIFVFTSVYRKIIESKVGEYIFPKRMFIILISFSIFTGFVVLIQSKIVFDTGNEWFGFFLTFFILGLYAWLTMARIARGQILEIRSHDYVTAARALGASPVRIIFKHSIPNILGPVIIYATINIPAVILLEAFLSFLGLGISEPYCSWGTLAKDGFQTLSPISTYWWMIVYPGGMMAVALFALNFLGDGIRDAIDPRMR